MNFLHSLHHRFEISNLAWNEKLHDLQLAIHQDPTAGIHCYSRWNFVILGFRKLCRGELTLEDFFKLGDIEGEHSTAYTGHITEACFEIEQHLDKNPDYYRNSLVVIEQGAKAYYKANGGDFGMLAKSLKYVGAVIFVVLG